jgi:hypothetical protein
MPKDTDQAQQSLIHDVSSCTLFHICSHCNDEYEVKLYLQSERKVGVATLSKCTKCGKHNHLWVRLVV